jgi:hypothetical protein
MAALASRRHLGIIEMARPGAGWITRAADADRSGAPGPIDRAVAESAREIGVADPPPRRIERTARFTET